MMIVNSTLQCSISSQHLVLFPLLSSDVLSNRWVLLSQRMAGRCTVQLRTLTVDVFVRWSLLSRRSALETPEPNSSDSCWRRYEILLLIIILLVIILVLLKIILLIKNTADNNNYNDTTTLVIPDKLQ